MSGGEGVGVIQSLLCTKGFHPLGLCFFLKVSILVLDALSDWDDHIWMFLECLRIQGKAGS